MHELSVCLALIGEVERIAAERGGGAVTRISVELGPMSGIEPELLRNAYPLAAAGTVAEHAGLDIRSMDIIVECTECGAQSVARPNRLLCGACGDYRTRLVSGDELMLRRIEIEPPAEPAPSAAEHGDNTLH